MKPRRLFAMLLLAGGLLGCQKTNIGPSPGLADPYPAPLNDPQVSVHDEDLRTWLGFQPAVIIQDGERPMEVQVPVRNLSDQRYLVQYRIVFYDKRDGRLEPAMDWRRETLGPKQVVRLKGRALGPHAVNYRLEVKWAR